MPCRSLFELAATASHYPAILAAFVNLPPVVVSAPLPTPGPASVDTGVALASIAVDEMHVVFHVLTYTPAGAALVVDARVVSWGI